jgi:hypothetical protein
LNGDAGGGPADTSIDTNNKPDVMITDAGADVPSDAPFCKRADHSLCDDFDEQPLGAAWTGQHVSFATLAADDAASTSSPSSLLAIDPTGTNGAFAYLEKDFSGSASRLVCEMQMRVENVGGAPIYTFQVLLTPKSSPITSYAIAILQFPAKTQINEVYGLSDGGTGGQAVDFSQPISADAGGGSFTHVVIDMMKLGSSASISVALDGTTVLATALSTPPSTAQMIRLGFQEYGGTTVRARYDDVACDITP